MSSNNDDDGVDGGVLLDDTLMEKQERKKSSLPQSTIADIMRGPTYAYVFTIFFSKTKSNS